MSDEMKKDNPGAQPIDYASPKARRSIFDSPVLRKTGRIVLSFGKWTMRVVLALLIIFGISVGFGTSSSDAEKMRSFSDCVDRWQHNPDFRKAQIEYAEQGSDAMRTKVAWIGTTKAIMWLRSLPFLPPEFAVSPTSQSHYDDFTFGPLSAYMHLTGEQGLPDTLNSISYFGSKEPLTDDDIRQFIDGHKLTPPVVHDAGAIASVRSLFNDIDGSRKFAVHENVGPKLMPHIASIAKSLGYPTEMRQMNPTEQLTVWRKLDGEVHETDYELWRTKQVNDWLNGVWGRYTELITAGSSIRF